MRYPKRKRALEVLATFNPATIEHPIDFLGWPRFFALVEQTKVTGMIDALCEELEKLTTVGRQESWILPLRDALFETEEP